MVNRPHDVFRKLDMAGGDPEKCWEWQGGYTGEGRPCFDLSGRKVLVYRLVYELVTGNSIPKGMVIRHKCDNPKCANPQHLELGTHQENMNDLKERERHGLPHHAIRAIRHLLAKNRPHEEIAELYGVDRSTIGRISSGRAYSHVTEKGTIYGKDYSDKKE